MRKALLLLAVALSALGALQAHEEGCYKVYGQHGLHVCATHESVDFQGYTLEQVESSARLFGASGAIVPIDNGYRMYIYSVDYNVLSAALDSPELTHSIDRMRQCPRNPQCGLAIGCEEGCVLAADCVRRHGYAAAGLIRNFWLEGAARFYVWWTAQSLARECFRCCEAGGFVDHCIAPAMEEARQIGKNLEARALQFARDAGIPRQPGPFPLMVP